jgi:menaquinone-9 beta-reductase
LVGVTTIETQVVVVGGGPAGLATALELRQRGVGVVVIDARRPPIDKACGEGIMPDGVRRLQSMGVELDESQWRSIRGIRYLAGDRTAEATFPGDHGRGVRRTTLHTAMVEQARRRGVELIWGQRVEAITEHGVRTGAAEIAAPWIVGADGLRSEIRRWSGLERPPRGALRFGVRQHFEIEPWSELVEVYWEAGCEAYVTPVGRSEVGVALLWSGEKANFHELLARHPRLASRLRGVRPSSRVQGIGPLHRRVAGVAQGKVALVGDAAGYRDAITGEGLSLAFHQAAALAAAIDCGDLREYEARLRRLVRLPNALIAGLLFVERRTTLRQRLIATLADDRELFSRLLAIHAREQPLSSFGLGGTVRLAVGLMRPVAS